MHHAMFFEHWLGVGGFAHRFDAATLVDGNIHHDRTTLHGLDHCFAHHHWRPRTRHEHCTNHQVGIQHTAFDGTTIRSQRHDATLFNLVDEAQAIQIFVEQHHFGFHAGCDACRIPTHVARTDDHHFGGPHTGRATHQHAATAIRALQIMCTSLRGKTASNFTHRRQERQ